MTKSDVVSASATPTRTIPANIWTCQIKHLPMSEPSYVDIAKDRLGTDGPSNHHNTSTNAYDSMSEPNTYAEIGNAYDSLNFWAPA